MFLDVILLSNHDFIAKSISIVFDCIGVDRSEP